jgi:hydroxymethylpyrimidine/phosphomethylpyrimidine kinase
MSGQARPWQYPRVLSIAGSDSGGGAGVQADLKTFAALGCYGMTAITALTAQNTLGVRAIHAVPLAILADQIDAVVEDIGVDAVKIGMLHSAPTVRSRRRRARPPRPAASGARPRDGRHQRRHPDRPDRHRVAGARAVPARLAGHAQPGRSGLLVERPLRTEADMEAAARQLLAMGARAVLLKGGHLQGDTVSDLLLARRFAGVAAATAHRHRQHAWHGLHAVERHRRLPGLGRRPRAGRAPGERVRAWRACAPAPTCAPARAAARSTTATHRSRCGCCRGHEPRLAARHAAGGRPLLGFIAQDGCTDAAVRRDGGRALRLPVRA